MISGAPLGGGEIKKRLMIVVSGVLILGLAVGISGSVLRVPSQHPTIWAGIDASRCHLTFRRYWLY
jgi:hypothetical protein